MLTSIPLDSTVINIFHIYYICLFIFYLLNSLKIGNRLNASACILHK